MCETALPRLRFFHTGQQQVLIYVVEVLFEGRLIGLAAGLAGELKGVFARGWCAFGRTIRIHDFRANHCVTSLQEFTHLAHYRK